MTDCPAENVSSTLVIYADFGGGGQKSSKKKPFLLKIQPNDLHFFFLIFTQDGTGNIFVQNKEILTKKNYDVVPP